MFFIRTAQETDLEKLRDLLVETWRETYAPFHGFAKIDALIEGWHALPAIKARLNRPDAEFLVADSGAYMGGMAYAAMSRREPKTANLNQLYVHPLWQRQGIGSDLFAEIETCFPDAEKLRLEVTEENDRAIDFYTAHGMSVVGRTDNAGSGGSGIPALIMEKKLAF
ncbi:GNAT family N-acetyltransferase [Rhizobium sp. L1K21]|uniref:GNAT family N-acetyltransferase n=1 Tax=Rhizobium sp. L1K21 TaxID=2954933 RepID=UPI002093836E|nr:N-acetyltransferase [Rhizobium sp. L1K21]MCO6186439.1 GNAT family N-acetyltransferase [Rhizobium sp. L1K21]